MANKSRGPLLLGKHGGTPSTIHGVQPSTSAYCNLVYSSHPISVNGMVTERKHVTEEGCNVGEFDIFTERGMITAFPDDAYNLQDRKTTLNILTAASAILDISTKTLESKGEHNASMGSLSEPQHVTGKVADPKTLRRLAQNREAARKSRLRKKAYVQQLESSSIKLSQMEQELSRVHQQGSLGGGGFYNDMSIRANGFGGSHSTGAAAFNMKYAHWLDEKSRQMGDLRTALRTQLSDNDLQVLVETFMSLYDEIFQLKNVAVKADVVHLLTGMWKTPAERCFLWLGGFRPSEILKILLPHIEPLTEQQILGIYNLQQSAQQAEDALSQGFESLQQTLAETLSWGALDLPDSIMATYLNQMAIALGKLGTLESLIRQADHLRQQTLKQMQRLLTVQQMAQGLLAMGEHFNRLRALSSLWLARPKE